MSLTERRYAEYLARFLSWKLGRPVVSPYLADGQNGEDEWQRPMRYGDTGEPVTISLT